MDTKQPTTINAFEAKTKLSELLRETQAGRSFVIHRRGKPVARLVPPDRDVRPKLKALRSAFQAMRKRMRGAVDLRALIEDGRRF
jgi:prevent-host-death family protein